MSKTAMEKEIKLYRVQSLIFSKVSAQKSFTVSVLKQRGRKFNVNIGFA